MRKRTKIFGLVCGALLIESIVMLNVPWCESTSFLIVNKSLEPFIDVAILYEDKKYWQGRLGRSESEQATVPTWQTSVVDIQVTLASGAKLTPSGTYIEGPGYHIVEIWNDDIEFSSVTGSGYLDLRGGGLLALFLNLADSSVRRITCPVRWAVTSTFY